MWYAHDSQVVGRPFVVILVHAGRRQKGALDYAYSGFITVTCIPPIRNYGNGYGAGFMEKNPFSAVTVRRVYIRKTDRFIVENDRHLACGVLSV